jgi:hypothetical protein
VSRTERVMALGLQQATLDNVDATVSIMGDISMERALQDHQWGGQPTDDTRAPADWAQYIHNQLSKMFQEEGGERDRFVKVAALAVAAIQSIDRTADKGCGTCPACLFEAAMKEAMGEDSGVHVVKVGSMAELVALLSGLGARRGGGPG